MFGMSATTDLRHGLAIYTCAVLSHMMMLLFCVMTLIRFCIVITAEEQNNIVGLVTFALTTFIVLLIHIVDDSRFVFHLCKNNVYERMLFITRQVGKIPMLYSIWIVSNITLMIMSAVAFVLYEELNSQQKGLLIMMLIFEGCAVCVILILCYYTNYLIKYTLSKNISLNGYSQEYVEMHTEMATIINGNDNMRNKYIQF